MNAINAGKAEAVPGPPRSTISRSVRRRRSSGCGQVGVQPRCIPTRMRRRGRATRGRFATSTRPRSSRRQKKSKPNPARRRPRRHAHRLSCCRSIRSTRATAQILEGDRGVRAGRTSPRKTARAAGSRALIEHATAWSGQRRARQGGRGRRSRAVGGSEQRARAEADPSQPRRDHEHLPGVPRRPRAPAAARAPAARARERADQPARGVPACRGSTAR